MAKTQHGFDINDLTTRQKVLFFKAFDNMSSIFSNLDEDSYWFEDVTETNEETGETVVTGRKLRDYYEDDYEGLELLKRFIDSIEF